MSEIVRTYTFKSHQRPPNKKILNISDSFFSIFIVCPLVVCFWYSTWEYMNKFQEYYTGWGTFLLGMTMHSIISLAREYLVEKTKKWKKNKTIFSGFMHFIALRFYTYVFAISIIMHWRGGWLVLTEELGRIIFGVLIVCI